MDVGGWLRSLGLEQYEPAFRENRIDSEILPKLTAEDLKDLGVALVGDRRRLLEAIASLRDAAVPPAETTAAAAAGDGGGLLASEAERRQLTVMMCDLVGSTSLSARLGPEDMREIIGAYHHCCAEQIEGAGGFVAKYMGDGVLAYFGYPEAHEDDAERAVRAALGLTAAIPKLQIANNAPLQVRIGVATGLVVVGDLVGRGDAQERGVVGDTPNLAARLEALAERGTVVIAEGTRRLARGLFDYDDLGRVPLKGLTDPVQAWRVLGLRAVESRFEAQHETSLTPLVGRDEELDLLLRRWRRAAGGEGCVVLLSGEPGIGKSRLAVALEERLGNERHTRLRHFCSPQHGDSALYPIVVQLERAAGLARHDTPQARVDKLEALLGARPGHESDLQLFAELLSIPTGDRWPPLDWSPQRKKEKIFEALLRRLEVLSRRRPVLAVYEDVHWIDPSSRELLDMTVERVAQLRVLLVITFRPEFRPPWTGLAHVSTLSLNRLGRREGAALAALVASDNPLPEDIAAEIVERSDGIPLFVEELTKAVVEAGAQGAEGKKTLAAAPLSAPSVPATLHASLIARLDRLGPAAKEIAQVAAVIGREFSYELLMPVAQKSEPDLRSALDRLTDAGLVFCRGAPPQTTFSFKHALVRDAAYGTLLRGRRQALHARVVATLEQQFLDAVATEPERLAQHCAEAGLAEKAIGYWLAAGRRSLARSATVEAVAQLRKGLALLSSVGDDGRRLEQELELQSTFGRALMATMGYASAEMADADARARELCERLQRRQQLVPVLFRQCVYEYARGKLDLALGHAAAMRRLAEAENDRRVLVTSCRMIGQLQRGRGEFGEARARLEEGLALFDPADRPFYTALALQDAQVAILNFLSDVLGALGYLDQSRARGDEALAAARRLAQPFTLVMALHFSMHAMARAGRVDTASASAALPRAEELEALVAEHNFRGFWGVGLMFRGWCRTTLGQTHEGIALLEEGFAAYRKSRQVFYVPLFLTLLADAHRRAGRTAAASARLAEAIEATNAHQDRWFEAEIHRLRGEVLRDSGDHASAEACLRTAIDVARRQSAKLWELRSSVSLAQMLRDQGKRTEARDLLAPVYDWFTEGFDTPDLKGAAKLLSELA
jgi:class 3 adenylate cyclase/predicted ATPase